MIDKTKALILFLFIVGQLVWISFLNFEDVGCEKWVKTDGIRCYQQYQTGYAPSLKYPDLQVRPEQTVCKSLFLCSKGEKKGSYKYKP